MSSVKTAIKHIAIIPDGNRRWAKQNNKSPKQGHQKGADNTIKIVKAAKELGIRAITFYTFSTENWKRSQTEIKVLMWLLKKYLKENCQEMISEGIRLHAVGDLSRLSQDVQKTIQETKEATEAGEQIDMILALNYGARDELVRACRRLVEKKEEINEQNIASSLDTRFWPDPELLIRTSGEMRLSNFYLWQLSYTELYMTPTLWPDFTPENLLEAIHDYQNRQKRVGR